MLSVFILAIIGVSAFIAVTRGTRGEIESERVTVAALAEAKAALLGYAAAVPLTGPERPGDMPCPDLDNDGNADPPCATEARSLGRLPWRTLGLRDLRDGSGERLWYAVSASFRNNPRSSCAHPADAGCLNSDRQGTITVRSRDDLLLADGTNPDPFVPGGAIAVIIAPGSVVTRHGAAQPQVRTCTVGENCEVSGRCTTSPATDTPTCNPVNYLDVAAAGSTEDNADFIEISANGFITGPVRAGNETIVNDRIALVTSRDLMPLLERRVVREVRNCLDQYSSSNGGRYPWAANVTQTGTNNNWADVIGERAGRIADTLFRTNFSSGALAMSSAWPVTCALGVGAWWTNWKLHVFYSVVESHQPGTTPVAPACTDCLTIETGPGQTLSGPGGPRYVVIVGGRRLSAVNGGQPRDGLGERSNPANFLEGENNFTALTPPDTLDRFRSYAATSALDHFNDTVIFR